MPASILRFLTIAALFLGGTALTTADAAVPTSPYVAGSSMQAPAHPWTTLHLPHALRTQFGHAVVEVFEYGCPYCRHLNSTLRTWGRTLPHDYTFTQMPALIAPDYLDMSMATFAVEHYEPNKLGAFESASFALVQGYHESINKPAVYIAAAIKAGISPKAFIQQVQSPATLQLTRMDYVLMRATLIHQTPTLVICGRYSINPSMVHGNYSVFLDLANGLLSRCIRRSH